MFFGITIWEILAVWGILGALIFVFILWPALIAGSRADKDSGEK